MCRTVDQLFSCGCTEATTSLCAEGMERIMKDMGPDATPPRAVVVEGDKTNPMKCAKCHKKWIKKQCDDWDERWHNYLLPMAVDDELLVEERDKGGCFYEKWHDDGRLELGPDGRGAMKVYLEAMRRAKEKEFYDNWQVWTDNTREGREDGIYEAFPLYIDNTVKEVREYIIRFPDWDSWPNWDYEYKVLHPNKYRVKD